MTNISIETPIAVECCFIPEGHSKKILDLVLIHRVPIYKIVLAFCGPLRLIPVQELYGKDGIEQIVIFDE